MPSHNRNGTNDDQRRYGLRSDQSIRDDRDDEGYRTSERYGQGQSGYEQRNQSHSRHEDRRYEDRQQQGMPSDRGQFDRGMASFHGQSPYNPASEGFGREGSGLQGSGLQGRYGGVGPQGGSFGGSAGGARAPWNQQQGSTPGFGYYQDFRGQHRGKGPQGWQRSDERIRDIICETLTDDDQIDATNIDVRVTSGEVVLTGMVPERTMKRMTEDLVERVLGVKDVQNQLKVGQDRGSRAIGRTETEQSKHRA